MQPHLNRDLLWLATRAFLRHVSLSVVALVASHVTAEQYCGLVMFAPELAERESSGVVYCLTGIHVQQIANHVKELTAAPV